MKPYVCGKSILFREVTVDDAEFIVKLRTDPTLNKHLSITSNDIKKQKEFILKYNKSITDYYFIICDRKFNRIGTIQIYDIQNDSFCWGSWILSKYKPRYAAIESAILIYDFAFFSLHYLKVHFDVIKENERVIEFHKRLGAVIVDQDDQNYYFNYSKETYLSIRDQYVRFLP